MGNRNTCSSRSIVPKIKKINFWNNADMDEVVYWRNKYIDLVNKQKKQFGPYAMDRFATIENRLRNDYGRDTAAFYQNMIPYLYDSKVTFDPVSTLKKGLDFIKSMASSKMNNGGTNMGESIRFKDEAVNTSVELKTSSKNNEYEFKFLVNDNCHNCIKEKSYMKIGKIQGYIEISDDNFSQVRISKRDDRDYGLVTIKTKRQGSLREEFQYRIPSNEAEEMIKKCKYIIKKDRYYIKEKGYEYTVDFFKGDNAGLVLAEVEFADIYSMNKYKREFEKVKPDWLGKDVTDDDQYYNDNLAKKFLGEC